MHQRRTYGAGLDEIVELTTDLDGDGALESSLVPLYDASGNLAAVTDVNGKPVERYLYSPYGATKTLVDSTPPRVEQVRIVGGELWVELSEEVLGSVLLPSHGTGGVTLIETATLAGHGLSTSQPVTSGRQAWRRVVYTPAAPGPAAGTEVTLTLTAGSLVDRFLNPAAADSELTFPWPAADAVLFDDTAPQVAQVLLQDGFLEVELTEEPDTATLGALLVDGTVTTWTLQSDRYTLRTDTALAEGAHQIVVGVALADLQGLTLAAEQNHSFNASASVPNAIVYREPDPRETSATTVANPFGFQGHPRDPETGLVYIRNRYYDPDMGRFVTADPLGYVDGPNSYQFALNSPVNNSDPLGLDVVVSPVSGSFTLSDLETGSAQTFTLGDIEADWGSFEAALRAATDGDDEYDRYRGEVGRQFQLRAVRRYLKDPDDVKGAVAHEQKEHPPLASGTTFCNVATRHIAGAESRRPGLAKKWGGCANYNFSFEISKNAAKALGSSDSSGQANRIYDRLVSGTPKDRGPWVEVRPSVAQQVANMGLSSSSSG